LQPVAFETFGPMKQLGVDFISEIGLRLQQISGDVQQCCFLFNQSINQSELLKVAEVTELPQSHCEGESKKLNQRTIRTIMYSNIKIMKEIMKILIIHAT